MKMKEHGDPNTALRGEWIGKRSGGRPSKPWEEGITEDARNWWNAVVIRDEWRQKLKEARTLLYALVS